MKCPKRPLYIAGIKRAKLNDVEEAAFQELFKVIEGLELSYAQAAFVLEAVLEQLPTAWVEERALTEETL